MLEIAKMTCYTGDKGIFGVFYIKMSDYRPRTPAGRTEQS